MIGYKGFGADWKCHGLQYKVGEEVTHDGKVSLCNKGLHFCEYPMDVFAYYPPTGRIAVVKASGVSEDREESDSKRVAKSLTVKAVLSIAELVSASIEYTTRNTDPVKTQNAKGDRSAASATGIRSAASATGIRSAASATGIQSAASATGDRSAASATGENAVAAALGYSSTAMADKGGIVVIAWHDGARKRLTTGYVGKDGIKASVSYKCDEAGKLVRA